MVGVFEIKDGASSVGEATVEQQGLYYRISCRCHLTGKEMHRLMVICNEKQEDLGTLVPMDGVFGLEKRIPVKRLGEGIPEFMLMSKDRAQKGKFIPVYPEEPFSYMSRLKDAYLERRNGQLGIVIAQPKIPG